MNQGKMNGLTSRRASNPLAAAPHKAKMNIGVFQG